MTVLHRWGIGIRLAGAFVAVGLLVALSAGVWVRRTARVDETQRRPDRLTALRGQMTTAALHISDITGWQGLYLADAGTSAGPAKAVATSDDNRKGFLESKSAITAWLPTVATSAMTPSERAT